MNVRHYPQKCPNLLVAHVEVFKSVVVIVFPCFFVSKYIKIIFFIYFFKIIFYINTSKRSKNIKKKFHKQKIQFFWETWFQLRSQTVTYCVNKLFKNWLHFHREFIRIRKLSSSLYKWKYRQNISVSELQWNLRTKYSLAISTGKHR